MGDYADEPLSGQFGVGDLLISLARFESDNFGRVGKECLGLSCHCCGPGLGTDCVLRRSIALHCGDTNTIHAEFLHEVSMRPGSGLGFGGLKCPQSVGAVSRWGRSTQGSLSNQCIGTRG